MASKNHVDSSVAERRLRPIYDWLDSGNNKRALQESEKVLKKQPKLQCARVLKALALLRLGKEIESEEILESVRMEVPRDDPTLQAMTICYREINKPEVICNLYAAASKVDPNNEELLTHLFMSYVRIGEYKKQQLTAMALYKLKPKNPYYFWAVMSIVMQAHKAEPDLAKTVVLPLAERMVERFVQEGKIEAEQEVQLYVMILEMQDKLSEALAVLNGPLGEKLQSYIVVPTKSVELLVSMKKWKEANIAIKKLLCNDMDNWSLYLYYLDTVFHLRDEAEKEEDSSIVETEAPDRTIEDCVQFLNSLQTENYKLLHQLRGPYIALLELFFKLTVRGENAESYMGSLSDLLINYFQRFGSKQCCLGDLKRYLNILNETEVTNYLDHIWKLVQLEDGQLPTSKDQMLRYISNLHITRYLGFHGELSIEAKLQLTSCLMRYYHHAAQFNEPKVLSTDVMQNDPFVMLVAHTFYDIWLETDITGYLKEAILVLEFALNKSPSNYQLKLVLIKIYNSLGLSKAAHRVFEILDIKHMQLDSLGYLQCWPLLHTGQYTLVSQLFDTTLKFFTSNYKDSADHLTFSYKFGSFLKIAEFVEFRDRLSNSLHYSLVTVEKMLMEILHTTSIQQTIQVLDQMAVIPEEDKTDWYNLIDNRDLEICWTADPLHRRLTQEMIHRSFQHDKDLLRIRTLLLRIIAALIELVGTPNRHCCNGHEIHDNSKRNNKKIVINLVDQLKAIIVRLTQKPPTRLPKDVFGAPPESRLFAILESSLPSLVVDLSELVINTVEISENVCELPENIHRASQLQSLEKVEKNLNEILKNLEVNVKNCNNESYRNRILNELTLHVEIVCSSAITCGIIYKLAKPNTNLVKKNKKKKEVEMSKNPKILGDNEKHQIEVAKRLVSSVMRASNEMITLLSLVEMTWKDIDTENAVCVLLKELEIEDSGLGELSSIVEHRITESYTSSISEIRSALKTKCKYLTELCF